MSHAVEVAESAAKVAEAELIAESGIFLRQTNASWNQWADRKVAEVVTGEQSAITNAKAPAELTELKAKVGLAVRTATEQIDSIFSGVSDTEQLLQAAQSGAINDFESAIKSSASELSTGLWGTLEAAGYVLYAGSQNWGGVDRFATSDMNLGPEFNAARRELLEKVRAYREARTALQEARSEASTAAAKSAWDNA